MDRGDIILNKISQSQRQILYDSRVVKFTDKKENGGSQRLGAVGNGEVVFKGCGVSGKMKRILEIVVMVALQFECA